MDKTEAASWRSSEYSGLTKQSSQLCLTLREGIGSWKKHDGYIVAGRQRMTIQPPCFPRKSPDPVSLHRVRICAYRNEYDSCPAAFVRQDMQPHALAREPRPLPEDTFDFSTLPDTVGFCISGPHDTHVSPEGPGSVGFLFVGGSEFDSALGSAPLKDKTTTFGLHSGAETELARSAHFTGLIGSLHGDRLLTMVDGAP